MSRPLVFACLGSVLLFASCADPAADKVQVTASAPKPETPVPTDSSVVPPVASQSNPSPSADPAVKPPLADLLAIDPADSKIEFVGSKVTGTHSGGFKVFTGTIDLTPDHASLARLEIEIDMNSIWSDNEKLTGHLKSADFFEVDKNPKTTFVSTSVAPGGEKGASHTITGNLSLHGVTKSISIPATITIKDSAPAIFSEFALNRKDFGIVYPGHTDDLIRDEVVIKIDVKAHRKS